MPAGRRGAMVFLAEVLSEPSEVPVGSHCPNRAPAENTAEEKLAEHYRNWIEKHSWTVAEDLAIRKAIHAFALANDEGASRSQQVVLPNRLKVSLDPAADDAFRADRDTWLKAQVDKALGSHGQ